MVGQEQSELIIQGSKLKFLIAMLACLGLAVATIPLFLMTGPIPNLLIRIR